jgi:conserved hypothetical protein
MDPQKKKKLLSVLQYILFLGLSIFLVWWSTRNITDEGWVKIKAAFRNANYLVVLPVMACLLLSHYSRALRWKILMEPLGYTPRVSNTYMAVLIGYMANLAVPRLGEVLKCTILARYEKVPADKLVGTIVAERAFDVVCLLIVVFITVFTQFDIIGGFVYEKLQTLRSRAGGLSSAMFLLLGAILVILIGGAVLLFKKFGHLKPVQKIRTVLDGIWRGLTSARYVKKKGWFIFHSVFIWIMYMMTVEIGFYAMTETSVFGITHALSVLTTGSVAMIVPVPGAGTGVYGLAVQATLSAYGLNEDIGLAFGNLMWSVQFFFSLISGAIALALLPYFNKTKNHEKG